MRNRIRVRVVESREHRRVEIALHRRVVRGELVDSIWMLGAVAEDDLHQLRRSALQALQVRGVLAELEQRLGPHSARQLRVSSLVRERAELARMLDTQEEVGAAEPAAIEERRLVDDVVAGAHRGERLGLERLQLGSRARVAVLTVLERLDAQAARGERLEVVPLVSGAEVREHLAQRGGIANDLLAGSHAPLQRHEMAACQVVAEIGGGVHRTAVREEAHQRSILARRRPRSRAIGRLSCRPPVRGVCSTLSGVGGTNAGARSSWSVRAVANSSARRAISACARARYCPSPSVTFVGSMATAWRGAATGACRVG